MNTQEMEVTMMQMSESLKVLQQQRDVAEDRASRAEGRVQELCSELVATREEYDVAIGKRDFMIGGMHLKIKEADAQAGKYVDDYNRVKARLENVIDGMRQNLRFAHEQRDQLVDSIAEDHRLAHWQQMNDMIAAQVPYPTATQKNVCERLGF